MEINLKLTKLLTLFLFFISSPLVAADLKSNILILMDYSNSYYTPEREAKIEKNFVKIGDAIVKSKKSPKKPTLIQILPINDFSQREDPICEYLLLRKGIGTLSTSKCGDRSYCSSSKDKFRDYMSIACKKLVFDKPQSKSTDISGALSLASQIGNSQTDNTKYLIFFSDMFEFRDSKIPVSQIDLENFKILVVCSSEAFEFKSGKTEFCMDTQEEWKSKFSELGAEEVFFVLETGEWNRKLSKGFFN